MNEWMTKNRSVTYEIVAEPGEDRSQESPLQILHRSIRGRVARVTLLAVALGATGALLGYNAVPPHYESTGLVRVDNESPSILPSVSRSMDGVGFSTFVASQATYLRSWPVLEAAVAQGEMRRIGWPTGATGVAALEQALSVDAAKGEQLISVTVRSTDPTTAQTAVNSVLNAYQEYTAQPDDSSFQEREQILIQREAALVGELQDVQAQILDVSDDYGFAAIVRLHEQKIGELIAIDEQLNNVATALSSRGEVGSAGMQLAADQVTDPRLESLRNDELALMAQLESLSTRVGSGHATVRELNRQLDAIRIEIGLREDSRANLALDGRTRTVERGELAALPADRLISMQAQLNRSRGNLHSQIATLGRQRMLLVDLQRSESDVVARLTETRAVLDQMALDTRSVSQNRVSIASLGDLPAVPESDRRAGLAAVGGFMGLVSGLGVFMLISIIDPRIRFIEDFNAVHDAPPVVGVIPALTGSTPAATAEAERQIHRTRAIIEANGRSDEARVVCVTSSTEREGKTSVAVALATSFAAAGRKTLFIDLDVESRGASIALGFNDLPGVCESIGSGEQSGNVHITTVSQLCVMPVGSPDDLAPQGLCQQKVVWLFDAMRTLFDVIVVDTGSVLNSVEAFVAGGAADDVVVVTEHRQSSRAFRKSISALRRLGARRIVTVFNRAEKSEQRQSHTPGDVSRRVGIAPLVSTKVSPGHEQASPLAFIPGAGETGQSISTAAQTRKAA